MHLHDAHLEQALRHAPDRDIAPSEATRQAVLGYAERALGAAHPAPVSWFKRFVRWLTAPQTSNWQLAGVGSVFATLLIAVAVWQERPEDPIWQATPTSALKNREQVAPPAQVQRNSAVLNDAPAAQPLPQEQRQASERKAPQAELAKELPEKLAQQKVLPAKKVAKDAAIPAESSVVLAEKPRSISGLEMSPAASPVELPSEGATRAREAAQSDAPDVIEEAKPTTPHAPALVNDSVRKTDNMMLDKFEKDSDAKDRDTKNKLAKQKAQVNESMATSRDENATTIAGRVAAAPQANDGAWGDNRLIGDKSALSRYDSALHPLDRLIALGGKIAAQQDIQTQVQARLFQLREQTTRPCTVVTESPLIDPETGYQVERWVVCNPVTEALKQAVRDYNQTMRDWHRNQRK